MTSQQPWTLPSHQFNAWYDGEIKDGLKAFRSRCRLVNRSVVMALQRNTSMSIKEVVKAGSLGKGTMLKSSSDLDCVVLVNPPSLPYLKDVQDTSLSGSYVKEDLAEANERIKTAFTNHTNVVGTPQIKPLLVTATIQEGKRARERARRRAQKPILLDVDILPTVDNVAAEGTKKLYESMMSRETASDRQVYSACLVKMQVQFIKETPGVVKELIRIVKHWNKVTVRDELGNDLMLPTSYPMELITVYAWEKAGRPRRFDRLKGLKAVLNVIGNEVGSMRHFWTKNYTKTVAERGISCMDSKDKRLPLILDPANPTNNICSRYHDSWQDVARVARDTMDSNLLSTVKLSNDW